MILISLVRDKIMSKELITNVTSDFKSCAVYKYVKKGQKSFRVSTRLLQSIFTKALKLRNVPVLILTIPANKNENFVLRCQIRKEKI